MSLICSISGCFLCLSFLLVWLSQLLQPQLFACCSFAQTRCPDLITAKNRDPTYISTSAHSQVSLYLSFSHLHSLYICGDISDNSTCLSAISCLELFCFLLSRTSKYLLSHKYFPASSYTPYILLQVSLFFNCRNILHSFLKTFSCI